jgi:hypothetical protein
MYEVRAGCIHNEILFASGDIMRAPKDVMIYSEPKTLAPGHSFSLEVARASQLFVQSEKEKILTTGPLENPEARIYLLTLGADHRHVSSLLDRKKPLPFMLRFDKESLTVGIDSTIVVQYKIPIFHTQRQELFRFITQRNSDGTFTWRSRGADEPGLQISFGHHDSITFPD